MTATAGPFRIVPRTTADISLQGGATVRLRRHGNPAGFRIFLSHGNGLAVDLYHPFWSRFLDDFDVIVFDFRNHGWNRCGDQKYHNPRVFAEDLETILSEASRVFGAGPCAGIFHSLSALVSLLLPSRGAELEALILFDPPLCKPGMSQLQFERHMEQALQMIRRRTTHFRTEAEFTALAEYSPLLRGLEHRVKQLLAQTTLRPSPDGSGYELRCPPDYEAQAGEFITAYAVLADLDTMRCPVKVIGADPTVPFTYLPSFDPEIVAKVDYDFIPEIGHFVPLAAPERSHELCLNFLREQGIVRAGA